MKSYLIDTNIIIDFFKNKPEAVSAIGQIKNLVLFISSITVAEFYLGAHLSNNFNEQTGHLQDFIKRGKIQIIPIGEKEAVVFGKLQADMIKKGRKKPIVDLLLASTCLSHDLILVSSNRKDFQGIPNLQIMK